jgi:hypothetical protein
MIWLWLLLISVASAILYRAGGCSPEDLEKEWGWVPKPIRAFPKKRDVGCNLCTVGAAVLVGITVPGWWNLLWLLVFGLTWASLSTYWDFLFGYDNHWMHGFVIGMSCLPVAFFGDAVGLGVRALSLAILMGGYSRIVGNATWEELGRGFVMPITLGLVVLI